MIVRKLRRLRALETGNEIGGAERLLGGTEAVVSRDRGQEPDEQLLALLVTPVSLVKRIQFARSDPIEATLL